MNHSLNLEVCCISNGLFITAFGNGNTKAGVKYADMSRDEGDTSAAIKLSELLEDNNSTKDDEN